MTKRCGRCGLEKPLDDFHRRQSGRQTWCKPCRRSYDAEYHQSVRPRRIEQARARQQAFAAWYTALKDGQPCVDCGGVFHPAAMQWDHRPGSAKAADVADLRTRTSKRRVL